jgi:hypothetical protein
MEKRMNRLLGMITLTAALPLAGCGATQAQLRARASLDLSCAPESIRTEALDSGTQVASGCGKRAIYVELFNNARHPTWMLNSNVEPTRVPPAAQAMR